MTDEQINIAIAESMGLTVIKCPFVPAKVKPAAKTVFTEEARRVWRQTYPAAVWWPILANYCQDEKAIRDVVRAMSLDLRSKFVENLTNVTQKNRMATCAWTNITAEAYQMAEAYLRTIDKWEESA